MCRTKDEDLYYCIQYYEGTQGGICVMPRGCQWRETSLRNHGIGQHIYTRHATPEEAKVIKSWWRLKCYWYNIDDLILDSQEILPTKMFERLKERLEEVRPWIKQRKPPKKQRKLPILNRAETEDIL